MFTALLATLILFIFTIVMIKVPSSTCETMFTMRLLIKLLLLINCDLLTIKIIIVNYSSTIITIFLSAGVDGFFVLTVFTIVAMSGEFSSFLCVSSYLYMYIIPASYH